MKKRILCILLGVALFLSAQAANIYWDGGAGADTNWLTLGNWNTYTNGLGLDPTNAPGAEDIAYFNTTALNAPVLAAINANQSIGGLVFTNTGTTTFTNSSLGAKTITLGVSGLTINSGAGTVAFAGGSVGTRLQFTLGAAQTWRNDSANAFALSSQNIIANGGNLLTIDGSGDISSAAANSGTGGWTKNGNGKLTLSGANTFSGGLTLNSGTLNINNAKALGAAAGVFTINGGTIDNSAAAAISNANNNAMTWGGDFVFIGTKDLNLGTGPVDLGTGTRTVTANASTLTVGGAITNSGSLVKAGNGTLTLTGANTYGGNTTINAGTLQASKAAALSGYGTASKLSVASGGTLALNYGGASDWTSTEVGTLLSNNGSGFSNGSFLAFDTSNGDGTYGSNITTANLGLKKQGANTLTLSGANSYAGGTTVSAGTLSLANTAAKPSSGTITVGAGAALALGVASSGNYFTSANVDSLWLGTLSGVTMDAAALVGIDTSAGDFTYGTAQSTRGLVKTGANALTLSKANTYTGATLVNSGTLKYGIASAIAAGSAMTVSGAGGATLDLANFNGTVASLTLGGANGTSASANKVQTGTGTLTLGGNVTVDATGDFTTAPSISGKLAFGNNTRTFTVADSAGSASDLDISAVISGYGLTKAGTGTLTLSGLNTYTRATTISAGALSINSIQNTSGGASSLGNPNATYSTIQIGSTGNDGTLIYTGAGHSSDRIINLAGTTGGATLQADGTGALVLSGANTATGAGAKTLTLQGSSTATNTISGAIIDNSVANNTAVAKAQSGTWVLSGNNTYSGGTILSNGVLVADHNNALGSGLLTMAGGTLSNRAGNTLANNINLSSAGTFGVDSAKTLTLSGSITNTGSLTKNGAGTLTLSGANTYSGGTTVSDGTLKLGVQGASTGAVTMAGGVYDLGAFVATNSTVTMSSGAISNGTLTGSSYALSGGTVYAGLAGGALTKSGAGTLTLSGANTYTGTTVSAGTLLLSGSGTLGDTSGALTASGGTLDLGGTSQTVGTTTISGGTINNGTLTGSSYAGQSGTVAAILAGNGALTKSTAGILTLSGANSYSGGTTLSAGQLNINNASALGSGTLNISAVATIDNTSGAAITLTNNNDQTWGGNVTFAGSSDLNMGTGAVTMTASRAVTVNAGTLTVGGAIGGGNYNIQKLGAGTLVLSGANTYSAGTYVRGGTLMLGANDVLPDAALLLDPSAGNAILDLNGKTDVIGGLTLSRASGVTVAGNTTLIKDSVGGGLLKMGGNASYVAGVAGFNNGTATISAGLDLNGTTRIFTVADSTNTTQEVVISGAITNSSGTAGLTKAGAGVMVLSGGNTYNGGTTVSAGTLLLSDNGKLGDTSGALTASGGTLDLGGTSQTVGTTTISGGTITNGTLTGSSYAGQSGTVAAVLAGSGALTKSTTGTLMLSGANSYGGGTTVSAGTLALSGNGTLGATNGLLTASTGGTLDLGGTSQTVGTTTISGGTITNGTLTGSSYDGQSGTVAAVLVGSGVLTKSTTNTLTLSGANSYGGGTVVSLGTLIVTNSGTLGSTSGALTASGGTLNLGNTSQSVGTTTISGGTITNGTLTGSSYDGQSGAVAAVLAGDSSVLTKSTSGTLTLSGTNTYGGGTVLNNGIIRVGSSTGALGTGALAINGGALSVVGTTGRTITNKYVVGGDATLGNATDNGTLTLSGTGDLGTAVRTLTIDSDVILNGVITNTGGLTKSGAGTLILAGNSTFSGRLTLNSGVLKTSGVTEGVLGAGTLALNGGELWFAGNTNRAYGRNTIVGGDVILTSDRSTAGAGFIYTMGTLGLGSQTMTVRAGSTVSSGNAGVTFGATTLGGASVLDVTNNTAGVATVLTLGALNGAGSLVKNGNGTLTLGTDAGTFSGGTALNLGTLNLNSTNALGTGGFAINGGTINNSSAATINMTNNNALTINNDFVFAGTQDLNLGAGATALGTAAGTSRAITVTANQLTLDGNIANGTSANQLIKDGAGTLLLTGTNAFTGGLVVKKGIINLGKFGTTAGGYTYAAGTGAITLGDAAGGDAYLGTGSYTVTNDVNLAVDAVGNLAIGSLGATRNAIYTGAIALNGNTLNFDISGSASATLKNYGAITGIGNLVLSNRTTVGGSILLGSNTVNNTGTITSYSAATNAGAGNVISANIGANVTGISVTKGLLTISGTNSSAGDITMLATTDLSVSKAENLGTGGSVKMAQNGKLNATGTFTTGKNIIFSNGGVSQDIVVSAGQTVTITGTVSSAGTGGSWRKDGGGTLVLGSSNSYNTAFTAIAGKVKITGAGTLGNGTADFTLNNANGDLGGTTQNVGAFSILNGQASSLSNGTLVATSFRNAETANGVGTVSAVLAGTGAFTHEGAGASIFAANNTYSGGTLISAGRIQVGAGGTDGTLGSGAVTNNAALVYNRSDVFTVNNEISGTGSLTNIGIGTLTLAAANTYTGSTTVAAGKLVVDGSLASSLITVNSGAALGGTGTVQAVTLDAGAFLLPGNSPGTLTFDGALFMSSGSTTIIEIASDILYDVLKGNNNNTLTAESGANFIFNFGTSGFGDTVTNGTTFVVLKDWKSFTGDGVSCVVTNLGAGKTLDTSALFTDGSVKVVPEPATIGLLGVGSLFALLVCRLRRKQL